jgi:hypothetical protein
MRAPIRIFAVLAAAIMLTACASSVQTSSGAAWLNADPDAISDDALGDAMRRAAGIEPTLRFPARIGLARIGPARGGPGLTMPSTAEVASWSNALRALGPEIGEFVPVSPLIAALVEDENLSPARNPVQRTVDLIRVAAARQHLDAVLIYEVDATADAASTPLSLAEWTLIGAFILPTQHMKVQAIAQAMLVDVRSGYHYGTVHTSADDGSLITRFGAADTKERIVRRARDEAVAKLAEEARSMFSELQARL